ncbi:hypothetical protein BJY04DRAFT_215892 [Aspergillus karnatakaensis]|uniref:putative MBL2-like secreted peptide n=1 Tax=Aspergillus karnatakaensis TaxID=1810916 RepID=UPI003CCD9DA6
MKLAALSFALGVLSLAAAAPAPEPATEPAVIAHPEPNTSGEAPTLEKRKKAQSCKIINADTYANCRMAPYLDGNEIFGLKRGETLVFACKTKGDCYNGNCTWDQITLYGTTCYVNGYFTDGNCSTDKLPAC